MYCGWRARIGLIMPGNGTDPEYEFHKYAPEGVTVMTQRVLFERVDPAQGNGRSDRQRRQAFGNRPPGSRTVWVHQRKPDWGVRL